jgi:hypothetical protein
MPRMHYSVSVVALFVAAFCAVPFAKAVEASGTVTGTVVDAEKKGVEAVDVSIYHANDLKTAVATTVTADDGTFTLKKVPAWTDYVVKAIKKKSVIGVRAEEERVAVEAGRTVNLGKLELKVPK